MSMQVEIQGLIRPVIESLGFAFWGLELLNGSKRPTVRVYIDHENGIGVDDCGRVSREISATLDVADVPQGEYVLEVSSPGIDRTLFRLEQFPAYVGEMLGVTLITPVEGKRRYKGQLISVQSDTITLGGDDHQIDLPFHKVKRARVMPEGF